MTYYQFYKRPVHVIMFRAGESLWTCAVLDPFSGSILWNPAWLVGVFDAVKQRARKWARSNGCAVVRVERAD